MQRYLLFFSYIGTKLRGSQAQLPPNVTPWVPGISRLGDFEDRTTVQGLFNIALKQFRSLGVPVLLLSSRTDTGVHALCSSGHVDLLHPRHEKGATYRPDNLVSGLNRFFDRTNVEISVQRALPVPDSFHSRYSAVGRAYLYRLGVVRPHAWPEGGGGHTVKALTPISERHRSYIVGGQFCTARLRECAALLSGDHDFRSFMGSRKGPQRSEPRTRRRLEIELTPGFTAVPTPDIEFWNIHFRSQGFLFRQVRRTVGVLVACARGRMSLDDVQYLLDHPDKDSWNSLASTAPPHGLYLSQVCYDLDQLVSGRPVGAIDRGTEAEAERPEETEEEGTETVTAEAGDPERREIVENRQNSGDKVVDRTGCLDVTPGDRVEGSRELSGAEQEQSGEMSRG